MQEHPLNSLDKIDPKLVRLVEETRQLAFGDGALPRKFKLLIAMGLHAANGADEGVRSLGQAAIQAGATKEEIAEALRVVHYISGMGSVYTAAHALRELL